MEASIIEARLTASERLQQRKPGDVIFREGETPQGVHILHSGEVDLLFSARNGNVKPLRVASSGQLLGLSAIVMDRTYDCSAMAKTECEVGFIPREELLQVLEERPALWLSVLRLLSRDVNSAYEDMRALTSSDARHPAA